MCRQLTIEALLCGHQHPDMQKCACRLANETHKPSSLFCMLFARDKSRPCNRPQVPQTCLKESICPSCKARGFGSSNIKGFNTTEEGRLAKKEQVKRVAIYSEMRPPTATTVATTQSVPHTTATAATSTRRPRPPPNRPPKQYRKMVDGPALSPGANRPGQHPRIQRKPVGRGRRETTFAGNKNEKMNYFIGGASSGVPFEDPSITASRESTTPDSLRHGNNKPLPPQPLRVGESRRRQRYYSPPLPSPKRQRQQVRQKTPPPPTLNFALEPPKVSHAEAPIYHPSPISSPPRLQNTSRWSQDTPPFSPSPLSTFTPSEFLSPGEASIAAIQLSPVESTDTQYLEPLNGWFDDFSETFDGDSMAASVQTADWNTPVTPIFEQTPHPASSRRSSPLIGPPSLSLGNSLESSRRRTPSCLETEIPRFSSRNKAPASAPVSPVNPVSAVSPASPGPSCPKFILQPTVYKRPSARQMPRQIPVRRSSRMAMALTPPGSSFGGKDSSEIAPRPPASRKPLKDDRTYITPPEALNLEVSDGPAPTPLRTAKTAATGKTMNIRRLYTPVDAESYSFRSKAPRVEVITKNGVPMRAMPQINEVIRLPSDGACERMEKQTDELMSLWRTAGSRLSDDKGRKYKY